MLYAMLICQSHRHTIFGFNYIHLFSILDSLLKNSDVYYLYPTLPNLLSSLARRFACCQSCSVSLRTLWAYGFDSAARRALEKSKVGERKLTLRYHRSWNFVLKSILRRTLRDHSALNYLSKRVRLTFEYP